MKVASPRWRTALAALLCATVFLAACGGGSRAILVPRGEPIRLRKTIIAAEVWVADKDGKEVEGVADLAAGWY